VADPRDDLLIAELRDLGDRLDVPSPADQRAAVRARLERPARRWHIRRWIAAAAAAVVCTVVAVPPARAAVVDAVGGLLRVAGIEVRKAPGPRSLPVQPSPLPSSPLPSIRSAGLDEARKRAKFPVLVPASLGVPDDVTLADPGADGAPRVVTLLYRGGTVRVDQFDGSAEIGFLKTAPDAQWMDLGGRVGIWLPAPHSVTYVDRAGIEHTETARLAGPTLIWVGNVVTYRLEGVPTLDEARAVALSMG
jgi:hypothetical protein